MALRRPLAPDFCLFRKIITSEAALSVGGLFHSKISVRCLLMALSGQSDRTRVCPLLDQSGQRSILARGGLSANDPKRTCHAAYMSRLLEELGIEVIF